MIVTTFPLRIAGIINVNGGFIRDTDPLTFVEGRITAKTSAVSEPAYYTIGRGGYFIEFEHSYMDECINSVKFELIQKQLFMSGMTLSLNVKPFCGYLISNSESRIQVGAKLAELRVYSQEEADD